MAARVSFLPANLRFITMPSQLALYICVVFIMWLYARDRKLRPMTSAALWVPLLWILIIGSRPISNWFSGVIEMDSPDGYLEGSPMDRNIFLFLIITGLLVLLKRRADWSRIFSSNRWLFAFFLYCGISVIWSDYPFVGFKRWIKDIGHVIIVLIILTEKDPIKATKAVFLRYAYIAIPLSVVFIKYFPEIGRYYNRWTWEPSFGGITLEKNTLGPIAFICGLFLVWDLLQKQSAEGRRTDVPDLLSRAVLLIMVLWLIVKSQSSTSFVCLILGTGILLFMRYPIAKRQVKYIGTYSLTIGFLIFLLYTVPGVLEAFVRMVGRDMTFTGRTDLWADLLKETINPIIGTGYQSFWLGSRAEHLWSLYYFHPNQAHNGFLETYLNGGVVGVCLLMAMIVSTGSKLKKELLLGDNFGILRFSFFVVALFSNWTEATFNRLSLVWIILIMAAMTCTRSPKSLIQVPTRKLHNYLDSALPKEQTKVPILSRYRLNSHGVSI